MWYVIGGLVVVFVLLALVNREAVAKLVFNLRAFLGAGATSVDNYGAVKNMKQAVDDAKREIDRHSLKLGASQGEIISLERNSKAANDEVAALTERVQTRATECKGNTDDPILLDLASQLGKAQVVAGDAAHALSEHVAVHNTVLADVLTAVIDADNLEKQAERQGMQLDLSASRAALANVGISFGKSSVRGNLKSAEGYATQIQKQIDANNGIVQVAKQLSPPKVQSGTASWIAAQDAKKTLAKLGIGAPASPTATSS